MELADAIKLMNLLSELVPTLNDEQVNNWGESFKALPDPTAVERAIRRLALNTEKFLTPAELSRLIAEETPGDSSARLAKASDEARSAQQRREDRRREERATDERNRTALATVAAMDDDELADVVAQVLAKLPPASAEFQSRRPVRNNKVWAWLIHEFLRTGKVTVGV